jgi:hypothetical protein
MGAAISFGKKKLLDVSPDRKLSQLWLSMESRAHTPVEETILILDSLCLRNQLDYAIFGGIASILYGSGRSTIDIDLIVRVDIDSLEVTYKRFIEEFTPLKKDPLEFFKQYYVLPAVHNRLGTKVDISAALSQFEQEAIRRSRRLRYGTVEASFCSPEDLILFKLVANRERDILDVKDIVKRIRDSLDTSYLRTHARGFIEVDRPDILENVERLLQ